MKTGVSMTYLFAVGFHWGEFESIQFPAEVRTRYLWCIEPHTAQYARENPVDEIRGKKNFEHGVSGNPLIILCMVENLNNLT